MALTYYCPSCWNQVRNGSDCASCGADLGQFASESYEQKLIRALRHPEPTVPIRAATFLGMLGSQLAVEPLIDVALSSADPYIQEAAVTALGNIRDPGALPCLTRLSRDGVVRLRIAADRAAEACRAERRSADDLERE
jgi:HEAT repeat protein